MPVRTRLSLAVALLVALLLALTASAAGCLWSLHLPAVAGIAVVAGAGAIVAVLFAYGVARELPDPFEAAAPFIEPAPWPPTEAIRATHLPPEYLAAVMKGVQARHAAFRAAANTEAAAR